MKIQVQKSLLQEGLNLVSATLSEGAGDASAFFLISPAEGGIHLRTYHTQAFSQAFVEAQVEGTAIFSIPGKRLKSWLRTVKDDTLTIVWDEVETLVRAQSSLGEGLFQPKEPTWFPINAWETLIENAELKATVEASRLASALSHIRKYVSQDETNTPQYCVAEFIGGVLHGTNIGGNAGVEVSSVKVAGMENSQMRVHGKNANTLIKFLSKLGPGSSVEIFEHERAYILTGPRGQIFGESRVEASYGGPELQTPPDSTLTLSFDKEDFVRGLVHLWSSADWEQPNIQMSCTDLDHVTLKAKAPTGHDLSVALSAKIEGDTSVFETALLNYSSIQKILSVYPEQELVLKIHVKGSRGGWLVFDYVLAPPVEEGEEPLENPDHYLTLMKWKTA